MTAGDYLSGLLQGTRRALSENGRDSITITVPDVTPKSVGALIALYERAVSIYACLVNICACRRPGVGAGKEAAAGGLAAGDVGERTAAFEHGLDVAVRAGELHALF